MNLYFYEGFKGGREHSEALTKVAVSMYCLENNIDIDVENIIIYREEGKKPYGNIEGVFFNVSHTGCLWVCAVSRKEVGIDIQEIVEKDYERISDRYFTDGEKHHVRLWGEDAFFELWTRKEAYGKLYGESIISVLGKIDMLENEDYATKVKNAYMYEIEISPDIKCIAASEEGSCEICIKMII